MSRCRVEQKQYIKDHYELLAFYNYFQSHLLNLVIAARATTSGLIDRKELPTKSLGGVMATGAGYIPVVGQYASGAINVGASITTTTLSMREQIRLARVAHFTTSIQDLQEITERVSRALTLRYTMQILLTSTMRKQSGALKLASKVSFAESYKLGGAEILANTAATRVFDFIADGKIDLERDVVQQLVDSVFNTTTKRKSVETQEERQVKERKKAEKKKKSDNKDADEADENKDIENNTEIVHKSWSDEGVFCRSGIVTPDGKLFVSAGLSEYIQSKVDVYVPQIENKINTVVNSKALAKLETTVGSITKSDAYAKVDSFSRSAMKAVGSIQLGRKSPKTEDLPTPSETSENSPGTMGSVANTVDNLGKSAIKKLGLKFGKKSITSSIPASTGSAEAVDSQIAQEEASATVPSDMIAPTTTENIISLTAGTNEEDQPVDADAGTNINYLLKLCSKATKYGYRLGTEQEAVELGLMEVFQTQEEILATKNKYFLDRSFIYDYDKKIYVDPDDTVEEDLIQMHSKYNKMYEQMQAMQEMINKQGEMIEKLAAFHV
jgi:hypothetical protein